MPALRQNLDHLAALLHTAGVTRWVVSPGSRNAPIVAGFVRHGGFELLSFPDERSAAFAALGMSMADKYPAGIICTSGSAVLNLYPAICEAWYQRIPLFVLTADRPHELIDQWDGQTIHQQHIFEKHILGSFETPEMDDEYSTLLLEKLVFETAELALSPVPGPVHLNVPLRDPIYDGLKKPVEKVEIETAFRPQWLQFPEIDSAVLHADLGKYSKILLLAGQLPPNVHIHRALDILKEQYPIFADIASNQTQNDTDGWETAIMLKPIPAGMHPELIISFGLSFVSKALKQYLKTIEEVEHWHISPAGFVGDPFLTKPQIKRTDPALFLEAMASFPNEKMATYRKKWSQFSSDSRELLDTWKPLKKYHLTEYQIVHRILQYANENCAVHLANSMPVRYAGWAGRTRAEVYCNRGTSGIDGTLSTAVGYARSRPEQEVICITGDVGFFYDSNAFWCDAIPKNLKIVVLHNGGGKIFEFVDGPQHEPRMKPLIETPHQMSARYLAAQYHITFTTVSGSPNAEELKAFFEQPTCSILEIITV